MMKLTVNVDHAAVAETCPLENFSTRGVSPGQIILTLMRLSVKNGGMKKGGGVMLKIY